MATHDLPALTGASLFKHVFVCGISRTGTTLLATILDSHPDISMGYELLPGGIDDAAAASRLIREGGSTDGKERAAELRAAGHDPVGILVHRADRTLVDPAELADLLDDFSATGRNDLSALGERIAFSRAITDLKARKEGTRITGFKQNTNQIAAFDRELDEPAAAYVYIVRDPRDVWHSQLHNSFSSDVGKVTQNWRASLEAFEAFEAQHPSRTHLVRYEDLVGEPATTIDGLCSALDLPRDPAMDRFYTSKASVLRGGHANSEALSQDFFTSNVGRWRDDLAEDELRTVESTCYEGMDRHGYTRTTDVGFRFGDAEWAAYLKRMSAKHVYRRNEYARLVLPAVEAMPHLTWAEATGPQHGDRPDQVLVIRHDIDNDIQTAVRLARWEARRGIRTTYCVLHTAWYYGRHDQHRTVARSERMVEACREMQDLGHEINLHNNTIVAALRSRRGPYDVLAEELDYLRSRGLVISGTSTHGDPLCGRLGFHNMELFSETVYPSRGGERTVELDGHEVRFGSRSMAEFDLTYEGYDLPRDVYLTDSGGSLKAVKDTAGRAGFTRAEMSTPPPFSSIYGILTHPEWWDMKQDRQRTSFGALVGGLDVPVPRAAPGPRHGLARVRSLAGRGVRRLSRR